jgi:hypothetical protein
MTRYDMMWYRRDVVDASIDPPTFYGRVIDPQKDLSIQVDETTTNWWLLNRHPNYPASKCEPYSNIIPAVPLSRYISRFP